MTHQRQTIDFISGSLFLFSGNSFSCICKFFVADGFGFLGHFIDECNVFSFNLRLTLNEFNILSRHRRLTVQLNQRDDAQGAGNC